MGSGRKCCQEHVRARHRAIGYFHLQTSRCIRTASKYWPRRIGMPCIAGSGGSESGTTGRQSVAFPMWGILHCSEMSAGSRPKFLPSGLVICIHRRHALRSSLSNAMRYPRQVCRDYSHSYLGRKPQAIS